jgi:transcription initiation factor TFIID TATA-box-binding protein
VNIQIVNLIATADLNERIDLLELSKMPYTSYDPSKYLCVYFKDDKMESKVSIFPSGKLIVIGANSEEAAENNLRYAIKQLRKRGFAKNKKYEMLVRNIVVTVDIGNPIDIEELHNFLPGLVYEPEQFPGAIFRSVIHNVTVLIFTSGKMVMTGLQSVDSIRSIVNSVLKELTLQ